MSEVAAISTPTLDGNSPTTEGIASAHMQVMDAFDRSQITELIQALGRALGPEIPEATHEPNQPSKFRGGPYLLGGMYRRAWSIEWEKLPLEMRRALDNGDLERLKSHPAELVVQWAEYLPFAVVVIRASPGPDSTWVAQAAEGLLDALPGRLAPSNRIPRSETQLVICAKISDARMERIRDMMQKGDQDQSLRRDLAEGLRHVGKIVGALRLESPASNVLLVEGGGSSGNNGWWGPFRAFVFSKGNLGPHRKWEWDVPMWIPSGLGTHDWTFFNFHPFLLGAIRHARHISVEAGRLDESLSSASRMLPGGDQTASAHKVPTRLHGDLVALHTRLQGLSTALHLGSTRSQASPEEQGGWIDCLNYETREDQEWPVVRIDSASSMTLKVSKVQAEQDARQVLEGLERRVDRALDLVTVVENRRLNRSMRFWAVAAAILAVVGIGVTVLVPLLAGWAPQG